MTIKSSLKVKMGLRLVRSCVKCGRDIKDDDLITYKDGQWWDGDWHRNCLPLWLAMYELRMAFDKLKAVTKEAFFELWANVGVRVVFWLLMGLTVLAVLADELLKRGVIR